VAESLSTRFATEIAEGFKVRLGGTVLTRDLAANPLPHIGQAYIQGRVAALEARTPEQLKAVGLAQELVDEVKAADVIVLGSGMINFGLSSQLKAWFDHITKQSLRPAGFVITKGHAHDRQEGLCRHGRRRRLLRRRLGRL
jgi:FMN-dependent NADH-azoreductase